LKKLLKTCLKKRKIAFLKTIWKKLFEKQKVFESIWKNFRKKLKNEKILKNFF
jgi:acyl-[acyl carrier protein]--UDP-N-acetylglucosamine O-acyltransferase